jgi:hypothetical protein
MFFLRVIKLRRFDLDEGYRLYLGCVCTAEKNNIRDLGYNAGFLLLINFILFITFVNRILCT